MKKSVWIIDDDDIYQLIIKKLVQRSQVFEEQHYFKNALDVLERVEGSQLMLPDAILLDINMPQMDGWQFIERLRKLYANLGENTSIYIVSSSIAYSDKERTEAYPEIAGFLSKPLTVDKLKGIGEAINKKSPV